MCRSNTDREQKLIASYWMTKKELKSYQEVSTRDSTQRLYISRFGGCKGSKYCRRGFRNGCSDAENCLSCLSGQANRTLSWLMPHAFGVKTKIIDPTALSLLLYNKSAKTGFLIEGRIDLRQVHNNVAIVNKLVNARNNCNDEDFGQINEGVTFTKSGISTHLIIHEL